MVREYTKISDSRRRALINTILNGQTIKEAAKTVDVPYENAKAIYRVYRKSNRIEKRKNRRRKGPSPRNGGAKDYASHSSSDSLDNPGDQDQVINFLQNQPSHIQPQIDPKPIQTMQPNNIKVRLTAPIKSFSTTALPMIAPQ